MVAFLRRNRDDYEDRIPFMRAQVSTRTVGYSEYSQRARQVLASYLGYVNCLYMTLVRSSASNTAQKMSFRRGVSAGRTP